VANSLTGIFEQINALFAASADAARAPDERRAAEEIGFDRHGIKPSHVPSRLDPLNTQLEPMFRHADEHG